MSIFERGLQLVKNTNGIKTVAHVLSVDPVKIQLGGVDYASITAAAMADLKSRGSGKKTVSGWDYYGVENPNPQTRGPRSPSQSAPALDDLIMDPAARMAKIRAEMEAQIKAIEEASANRLATLQAKETELAARLASLVTQAAACETDLAKVRGAIASLTQPAPTVPTPVQAEKGKGKGK